jgi:hypothetical protein
MPTLSFEAIAGEADPPVAEQLVSSNALRQRRDRQRNAVTQDRNAVTQDRNAVTGGDDGLEES